MTPLTVEEVQTVADLLHRDRVFLRAMLEDQLLKEQEGTLVRDLLADLDERFPSVLRCEFRAVGTLAILYKVLDLEYLLEDGIR